MEEVFVVGVGQTAFGRFPDRSHKELAREAVVRALADVRGGAEVGEADGVAGVVGGVVVDGVVFGSCALGAFGQHSARGVHVLAPLVREAILPGVAVTDVEAACATGFVAVETAALLVQSGQAESAVAIGVDKTFLPDPTQLGPLFAGALDQLDPAATLAVYQALAQQLGVAFSPSPTRLLTLDVCALLAQRALQKGTTTLQQLADVAAAAHAHAAHNKNASKRGPTTAAEVLADKVALAPFTRSMVTGLADGAAAVVVASGTWLKAQPASTQARAVRLRALARLSGGRSDVDEPSVLERTVAVLRERASDAGIEDEAVDVVEVHDATAHATVVALEALGLSSLPSSSVNPSGGLIGKGHPLAATGLAMFHEVVLQLRGEAGVRQVQNAKRGLVHNAGGFAGLDEAVCGLALLSA